MAKLFCIIISIFLFGYLYIFGEESEEQQENIVFMVDVSSDLENENIQWEYGINISQKEAISQYSQEILEDKDEQTFWLILFDKDWSNYEVPPTQNTANLEFYLDSITKDILQIPRNQRDSESWLQSAIQLFDEKTSWINKWILISDFGTSYQIQEEIFNENIHILDLSENREWESLANSISSNYNNPNSVEEMIENTTDYKAHQELTETQQRYLELAASVLALFWL